MKVLLVEPDFPYPNKSKHQANEVHKNFVPIGLLKLGAYYKFEKAKVKLVRGNKTKKELVYFNPDKILITSLFTYWSKYVWDTVKYYRELFPNSKIVLGGVYVTLHHNTSEFKKLALSYKVSSYVGLHDEAEKFLPDYSLLHGKVDYHIMHAMRGCIRKCKFCGVWRLEPKLIYKNKEKITREIKKVGKNKIIFFDNNFFVNPHIKDILVALMDLRVNNGPVIFESQSGFDGRLLEKDPGLAYLLKKARFQNVRIAWDNSIKDAPLIKKQINYLVKAGYPVKDISVFMIYNFDISYEIMMKKLAYCKKWGVQIIDCRYRPIEAIMDDYNPHSFRKGQTEKDYYIHTKAGWSDKKIREFRSKVREHNIWIRYAKDKGLKYDKRMERWSAINNTYKFFELGVAPEMDKVEGNKVLEERIRLMNRIKNIIKKEKTKSFTLKGLSKKEIDKKINIFLKETKKN